MTDNGGAYVSTIHALACRALGAKHLRDRSDGEPQIATSGRAPAICCISTSRPTRASTRPSTPSVAAVPDRAEPNASTWARTTRTPSSKITLGWRSRSSTPMNALARC
jgi:hypothetical protein